MTGGVVAAAGPAAKAGQPAARRRDGAAPGSRKVAGYSPAAGPALKGKLRPRGAGKSKAPAARAAKAKETAGLRPAAAPARPPALAAPRPRPRRTAGEGARLSPIVRACGRSAASRARQTEDA